MRILVVFLAFAFPLSTFAAPNISWDDSRIEVTVGQGGTVTVSAFFVPTKDLEDVAFVPVPEIAGIVSASPSQLDTLQKGQRYKIDLSISAPSDAVLGIVEGTLHVRSASGRNNKTYAKPLQLQIDVWEGVADPAAGLAVAVPDNWFVIDMSPDGIVLSNVQQRSEVSDESLQSESRFIAKRLVNANPSMLPPDFWVDEYFSDGFAVDPVSSTVESVSGRDALRMETLEIGRNVHYYLMVGNDVIEVNFGLFAERFLDTYMSLLGSTTPIQ